MRVIALNPFGAEVEGVGLTQPLTEQAIQAIRQFVQDHQLLIFRNQTLTPLMQLEFTKIFGDTEPSIARRPLEHQVPGYPGVLYVSNEPSSYTSEYGFGWHSDGLAYARVPHGVTILHCISCPPELGDTLFASQYIAYELMPRKLQLTISNLSWELPEIKYSEVPDGRSLVHPMVRTHPKHRREFIFFSPEAQRIRGRSKRASADLLKVVREYQIRKLCIYRHSWMPNDLVVWENCALLHNRADRVEFRQGSRIMHRTATRGNFHAVEMAVEVD